MANKSESDSLSGEGSCSNDMELKIRTKYIHNNNQNSTQRQKLQNHENSVNMSNENSDDHQTESINSTIEVNRATYNKYTDSPIHLRQVMAIGNQITPNSTSVTSYNCTTDSGVESNVNNNNKFQMQMGMSTAKQTAENSRLSSGRNSSPVISRQKLEQNNDSKGKSLLIVSDESVLDPVNIGLLIYIEWYLIVFAFSKAVGG